MAKTKKAEQKILKEWLATWKDYRGEDPGMNCGAPTFKEEKIKAITKKDAHDIARKKKVPEHVCLEEVVYNGQHFVLVGKDIFQMPEEHLVATAPDEDTGKKLTQRLNCRLAL